MLKRLLQRLFRPSCDGVIWERNKWGFMRRKLSLPEQIRRSWS